MDPIEKLKLKNSRAMKRRACQSPTPVMHCSLVRLRQWRGTFLGLVRTAEGQARESGCMGPDAFQEERDSWLDEGVPPVVVVPFTVPSVIPVGVAFKDLIELSPGEFVEIEGRVYRVIVTAGSDGGEEPRRQISFWEVVL